MSGSNVQRTKSPASEETRPASLAAEGRSRCEIRWLDFYEEAIFGSLMIVALCAWVFIAIASNVVERNTHAVDQRILLALRTPDDPTDPVGSKTWEEIGRDITALGGYTVLTLLMVGVCGFLSLAGRRRMLYFLLVSVFSAYGVMLGLKAFFDRPRPTVVQHFSHVESSSFPSGHSMMSMVVFLTLGALLARTTKTKRLKVFSIAFAGVLSLLVGCSRVYVGVHYPSDVLAGWSFGIMWAVLSCLVESLLERCGIIGRSEVNRPIEG